MTRVNLSGLVVFTTALVILNVCEVALVQASDPELVSDFAVPPGVNASNVDGNYFTYTGFRGGVPTDVGEAKFKRATLNEFPALYGLGISFFLMYFQKGGVLPPHLHPRGTKLIYIIEGTLTVGIIDTSYKNYNQTLYEGDVYVVPKAMVHYMANLYSDKVTKVIFSFSSSNPGTLMLPQGVFGSIPGIPDEVQEKSFGVSFETLQQLRNSYLKYK